jgi:hypothetical protein
MREDGEGGMGAKITLVFQRCLEALLRLKAPEPAHEVVKLIRSLTMTPRQVEELYRTFRRLKQYDPITFQCGENEASTPSMTRLIQIQREWTSDILKYLLELAGFNHTINWDGFLYVFLQYCTLSKVECCQVLFYVIAKCTKSWTVNVLTSTQLDEFYEEYQDCPVKSFNTASVDFAKLPKAKYTMTDFIELVHHFPQLQAPAMHLQRQLQQVLPSLRFWNDYDRVKGKNRRITIDFFVYRKVISIFDVVQGAKADADKKKAMMAELEAEKMSRIEASRTKGKGQAALMQFLQKVAPVPPGTFPPPPAPLPSTFPNESMKLGFVPLPLGNAPPARLVGKRLQEIDTMPKWMRELIQSDEGLARPRRGQAVDRNNPSEEAPLDLPRPWVAIFDQTTERDYYWNPEEHVVSWQPPEPPRVLSVEETKRIIRATFETDPQYAIDDKMEALKTRIKAEEDRAIEKRRTQELEFIYRSRLSTTIQDSIVSRLERSYQCELIDRKS